MNEPVHELVLKGGRTLVTLTFAEPVNEAVHELVLRGGRTRVRMTFAEQGCTLEVENDEKEWIA